MPGSPDQQGPNNLPLKGNVIPKVDPLKPNPSPSKIVEGPIKNIYHPLDEKGLSELAREEALAANQRDIDDAKRRKKEEKIDTSADKEALYAEMNARRRAPREEEDLKRPVAWEDPKKTRDPLSSSELSAAERKAKREETKFKTSREIKPDFE